MDRQRAFGSPRPFIRGGKLEYSQAKPVPKPLDVVEAQHQLRAEFENDVQNNPTAISALNVADFMKKQEELHSGRHSSNREVRKAKHEVLNKVLDTLRANITEDATFHDKLRERGSNVPAPLIYAIEKYRLDDVQLLLSKHAHVNADGQTPMEFLHRLLADIGEEQWTKTRMSLALEFHEIATKYPSDLEVVLNYNNKLTSDLTDVRQLGTRATWQALDRPTNRMDVVWIHTKNKIGSVIWTIFHEIERQVGHRFQNTYTISRFLLDSFPMPAIHPSEDLLSYRDSGYLSSELSGYVPSEQPLSHHKTVTVECASIVFPCLALYSRQRWTNEKKLHAAKRDALHKSWGNSHNKPDPLLCNIQSERTLDEAYFPGMSSRMAKERNIDQVVSKEFKRTAPKNNLGDYPILMVPQLWLWRVGHFVVSAFSVSPDANLPYDLDDPLDKRAFIDHHGSADVMMARIIAAQIDRFGRKRDYQPPLDIFETAVLSTLSDVDEYLSTSAPNQPEGRKKHRPHAPTNKFKEKGFIELIADIRNELAMIQEVFEQQKEILDGLLAKGKLEVEKIERRLNSGDDSVEWFEAYIKDSWNDVEASRTRLSKYEKRLNKIDRDAERIEGIIERKLDLHRTYASMRDAHNSLIVSMAVVGFTVVTVIFAPLAFLTALFALDIDGFSNLKSAAQNETNSTQSASEDDSDSSTETYSSWKLGLIFASSEVITFAITGAAIWIALWCLQIWEDDQNKPSEEVTGGDEEGASKIPEKSPKANDAPV